MKSVMDHVFSMIPQVQIPRSVFDRTHGYKTTFNSGYLIPFYADEALPGDTFSCKTSLFARLATPLKPFMDNLFLETFYFAVPIRLLWDKWKKMNGEQDNPWDSIDFTVPQLWQTGPFDVGSIADYFGLPTDHSLGTIPGTNYGERIIPDTNVLKVNALHFRAYNLIYNQWFRDENLCASATVDPTDPGPDSIGQYPLQKRGKRHDYFTSCLLWPQKGPTVDIPIGVSAPVYGTGNNLTLYDGTNIYGLQMDDGASALMPNYNKNGILPGQTNIINTIHHVGNDAAIGVPDQAVCDAQGCATGLYTDLSSASAVTINTLRQAFQIQKMHERDARGGTRYTEIIRAHFGVISPDARLQRPEYLGGSSDRININPVQQTAPTDPTRTDLTPQGNLAAFGLGSSTVGGFTKSFTEHCVLIGLLNVRADLTYQQGVSRMWHRQTREDFYWPELAHLGEQPVYSKEIYMTGDPADDNVFGYQERYAEYRYFPSQITGKFRSTDLEPLDIWHLSQKFEQRPWLGVSFIEENVPIPRVIAVPSEPEFFLDVYMSLHCARPMPVYSVPGLIDHF